MIPSRELHFENNISGHLLLGHIEVNAVPY
jgi:riboflavin synthase alpha subunit